GGGPGLRGRVPDEDDEPPHDATGRDDLHDDEREPLLHELAAREGGGEPRRERRRADSRQRAPAAHEARGTEGAVTIRISSRLALVKPSATFAMAAEAAAL